MHNVSLEHQLQEYVHRHVLIVHGERIVIAVSGGIDSMVLLGILFRLQRTWSLELAVAHVNHRLRGKESDEDEAFVRRAAADYGLPCYVEQVDTLAAARELNLSLQEAARDLRLAFLNSVRTSNGFQKIATAHHADDNAETLLLNFIRGTGVEGLSGIPNFRRDLSIIRPLLCATRDQVKAYADANGITFREDSSNEQQKYTRNIIRHGVIPQLREHVNPNLAVSLRRTGELFDELEGYIALQAANVQSEVIPERSADRIVFDVPALHSQPVFLQEFIILKAARSFIRGEVTSSTVHAILNVSHGTTGTSCSLAKDAVVLRNRTQLIFHRRQPSADFQYRVNAGTPYSFARFSFTASAATNAQFTEDRNIEYIDATNLEFPLILRPWQDGDVFVPLGMKGEKKLSDFFIDEKIPLLEKHGIPILLSGSTVVWVCGKRLDNRWKVTPQTSHILKLEYQPHTYFKTE